MSLHRFRLYLFAVAVMLVLGLLAAPALATGIDYGSQAWLGALLYSDSALSQPDGQACADCHTPQAGFADPDHGLPVSEGVLPFFGGRNSPTSAYCAWSPVFFDDAGTWTGGMFWDGRATGWSLGSPLAEQARGPFLNPIEMHNADKTDVVGAVRTATYRSLFLKVYGPGSLKNVDAAYDDVARAIAAYESSRLVNTFSSRYDAYAAGARWVLTTQEKHGLALFNGKALCSGCHPSGPGPYSTGIARGKALFTDYTYDNLGIPQNPAVAHLTGSSATDYGLGGFLRSEAGGQTDEVAALSDGTFKVPTLRNVARTAPYGHNGYFRTLADVVHFYNTRDVPSAGWAAPEVPATVNMDELGNLQLTAGEEAQIVAFLRTLTDQVVVAIPDR